MPIAELRAHVTHAYAEFYNECGYCWLEGEANAGEFGGGGYDDYHVPNSITGSSFTTAARTCSLGIAGCVISHIVSEPTDHRIHGSGGEYAEEPAYDNPFAMTGAIGGFVDLEHLPTAGERFYNAYRYDALMAMQVARPIDMIIISGIS
jgi:hypothetical protein